MTAAARPSDDGPALLTLRQRQAAATRDAVVRAAWDLFLADGYTRTTIELVARKAGVSVATVYATIGSKRQLLVEVRRLWFREAEVSELVEQALHESDPRLRLQLAARWIRHQLELGSEMALLIDEAIRADPKVAEMWAALRLVADEAITSVIEGISGQIVPGVDTTSAVDVVWALSRASVYLELIEHRGWSADRYEQWLGDTLFQQLLGDTSVTPAASRGD